jgi:hypothetical protein
MGSKVRYTSSPSEREFEAAARCSIAHPMGEPLACVDKPGALTAIPPSGEPDWNWPLLELSAPYHGMITETFLASWSARGEPAISG